MRHDGEINQVDKSRRKYQKIKVFEINQDFLLVQYDNLIADLSVYLSNTKNNFKNLLDFNFYNKIVNKIHQSIDNFKIQIKQQQKIQKDYQQLIFEQKTKINQTIKDHIFKKILTQQVKIMITKFYNYRQIQKSTKVKEFKQFIEFINSDSDNDENQKPFILKNKSKELPKQLSKINFYMYMQYIIEGLQLKEQRKLKIIEDFLKQQSQNQQLKEEVQDINQIVQKNQKIIYIKQLSLKKYQQNVQNSKQQIKELLKQIIYYNNVEKRLIQIFNFQTILKAYDKQQIVILLRTFKIEQSQIREFYERAKKIYRMADQILKKIQKNALSMNHTENIVFYIDYKKLSDVLIQFIKREKQNCSIATLVYSYNSVCQSCSKRVKYYQTMLNNFTKNRLQEKNINLFAKRNSAFVKYIHQYNQQYVKDKTQQCKNSLSSSYLSSKASFTMEFLQAHPPSSPEKNLIFNIKGKYPQSPEKDENNVTTFHSVHQNNKPFIKINPKK